MADDRLAGDRFANEPGGVIERIALAICAVTVGAALGWILFKSLF